MNPRILIPITKQEGRIVSARCVAIVLPVLLREKSNTWRAHPPSAYGSRLTAIASRPITQTTSQPEDK
jgi:hypothetical protein